MNRFCVWWQAPEPLNFNWTETLKVHRFRDLCQSTEVLPEFYQNLTFSGDCLFINIYVPGTMMMKKRRLSQQSALVFNWNLWIQNSRRCWNVNGFSLYSWCWHWWWLTIGHFTLARFFTVTRQCCRTCGISCAIAWFSKSWFRRIHRKYGIERSTIRFGMDLREYRIIFG